MTEDTNTAVDTSTATEVATTPVKESKPRPPKLTVTFEGKEQPLLKYPFPVKAAKFPVLVNGEAADAAITEGRGKAYTYILYNNTSFYVPGKLPVDAVLTVNFPEGYPFDVDVEGRKSYYKPKAKAEGSDANPEAGSAVDNGGAVETVETEPAAEAAPKAKRRGK